MSVHPASVKCHALCNVTNVMCLHVDRQNSQKDKASASLWNHHHSFIVLLIWIMFSFAEHFVVSFKKRDLIWVIPCQLTQRSQHDPSVFLGLASCIPVLQMCHHAQMWAQAKFQSPIPKPTKLQQFQGEVPSHKCSYLHCPKCDVCCVFSMISSKRFRISG